MASLVELKKLCQEAGTLVDLGPIPTVGLMTKKRPKKSKSGKPLKSWMRGSVLIFGAGVRAETDDNEVGDMASDESAPMATLKSLQLLTEAHRPKHTPEQEKKHAEDHVKVVHFLKGEGFEGNPSYPNGYEGSNPTSVSFVHAADSDKKVYKKVGRQLEKMGYTRERPEKTTSAGGVMRTYHSAMDGEQGDKSSPWAAVKHEQGRCHVEYYKGTGAGVEEIPQRPTYY